MQQCYQTLTEMWYIRVQVIVKWKSKNKVADIARHQKSITLLIAYKVDRDDYSIWLLLAQCIAFITLIKIL